MKARGREREKERDRERGEREVNGRGSERMKERSMECTMISNPRNLTTVVSSCKDCSSRKTKTKINWPYERHTLVLFSSSLPMNNDVDTS